MKAPKMWRKRRGGKFVGSWRATVRGDEVNLGSSDAEVARKRLRVLVAGGGRVSPVREDLDDVADLEGYQNDSTGTPAAVPDSGRDEQPLPPPAPPPSPAAQLPPIPDQPPPPAAGDADDMAAAAADVAGGAANDNAADEPQIDPAVLDGFLRQGALVLVDAQLGLQAAIIRKRTGRVAGAVPADSPLRAAAAEAWVAQLKIWFPADRMLPPWAMALIIPALAFPAQMAGSEPPPDAQVAA